MSYDIINNLQIWHNPILNFEYVENYYKKKIQFLFEENLHDNLMIKNVEIESIKFECGHISQNKFKIDYNKFTYKTYNITKYFVKLKVFSIDLKKHISINITIDFFLTYPLNIIIESLNFYISNHGIVEHLNVKIFENKVFYGKDSDIESIKLINNFELINYINNLNIYHEHKIHTRVGGDYWEYDNIYIKNIPNLYFFTILSKILNKLHYRVDGRFNENEKLLRLSGVKNEELVRFQVFLHINDFFSYKDELITKLSYGY